jgi:UDPglucose--hexose-1-phosphate uridylyltransferase
MLDLELERRTLRASFRHPGRDFELVESTVEVRWDPLTGHSARIVEGLRLMPPLDFDLAELAQETASWCPFCAGRVEESTPRFAPDLVPEGVLERGEARLFPNLATYANHSAVSIYGADRHHLPLARMTDELVTDNLALQVRFAQIVIGADPDARWASISANHMLPSGSSLFHPHIQSSVDPVPMTMQRLLADVPPERFTSYLELERRAGERYLGCTGQVEWLASFAPLAPGELRAFVPGVASPAELDADLLTELGHGIATALRFYAELGYESFNLAIYGAPPATPGYPLNLRLACRSNVKPLYRSDATYFERLHWEGMVDLRPEDLVERAGGRFGR